MGAPTSEVMLPTGSSLGGMRVRAAVSQSSRKMAPTKIE